MKKQLIAILAAGSLLGLGGGVAGAAGSASFLLGPSGGTFTQGDNFTVAVYENGTNVNVVTAKLTFDPAKLKCVGVGGSGAFPNTIVASCGNGTATISRYTASDANGNPTTVSGSQSVGSVTFTAVSTGAAGVSFASGSQIASSGANIWNGSVFGGSYTLNAAANNPAPAAPGTAGGAGTGNKPVTAGKAQTSPTPKAAAGSPTPTPAGVVAASEATPAVTAKDGDAPAAVKNNFRYTSDLSRGWLWLVTLMAMVAIGSPVVSWIRNPRPLAGDQIGE